MIHRASCAMCVTAALAVGSWSAAHAQGAMADLLGGKLIKPKAGQWAWYELTNGQGRQTHVVRQAVVGEERVGRKAGHWVEFEIIPQTGFTTVYKMLLTGPATDPGSIAKIIIKRGPDEPEEVPVDPKAVDEAGAQPPDRKSLGKETVQTGQGPMETEHFQVESEGRTIDMWVNEDVRPTCVVKVRTPEGEMNLRSFGEGGKFAESAMDRKFEGAGDFDVEASVPNQSDPEEPQAPSAAPESSEGEGETSE